MIDTNLLSTEHIELVGMIVIPLGSGIVWMLKRQAREITLQAQNQLKLDLIWLWFTNHGHDITGYQPGDEKKVE